jgi:hypothetical protein
MGDLHGVCRCGLFAAAIGASRVDVVKILRMALKLSKNF